MHGKKKDMDFGKIAHRYDDSWGRIIGRFYHLMLEQVELWPGITILDVGCGTGSMLRKMADQSSINGFGIDMSENMIEEAKRKCPDMNMQISRCEETPFEDHCFDAVTTCLAYHHFSDRAGFAKEAARILKPGGRLYIADARFPGAVRKIMNAGFNLLRIEGAFFSPDDICRDLAPYGFVPDDYAKHGYAQVVKLKLAE